MSSNSREGIERDFATLHEVLSRILGHSYGALTTPERLGLLGKIEHETRRLVVPRHELINQFAAQLGRAGRQTLPRLG
jgi:hypothetical protein